MKKVLIIGGGFAGCSSAHQFQFLNNWDVTLVEKSGFLGAGVRTMWHGGHPHTYGPRHFLSDNREVYDFLNKYCPLRDLSHKMITYVNQDDEFYHLPLNFEDINKMPDKKEIHKELDNLPKDRTSKNLEEYWVKNVGNILYKKFIDDYNKKMWQVDDNKKLDTFEWSQKQKITKGIDEQKEEDLPKSLIKEKASEAFNDVYSCYPYAKNGYDDYFEIATSEAKILLNTKIDNYDIEKKMVTINGEKKYFDIIINTISPDLLFEQTYGELPFIGRDFHRIVLPMEKCFPGNTFFIYFANSEQVTRIVEYKQFTQHKSKNTLIGIEIPSMNGKHYPLPIKSEQAKAKKYFDLMPDGVFSIGRAGSYDYNIDIDDCIEQSIKIKNNLI